MKCGGSQRLLEQWRSGKPGRAARIYAELKGYTFQGRLTAKGERWLRPVKRREPGAWRLLRAKPKPPPEPERVAVRVVVPPLEDGERFRKLRAENLRRAGLWT